MHRLRTRRHDDIEIAPREIFRQLVQPILFAFCPEQVKGDIAALDEPMLPQPFP